MARRRKGLAVDGWLVIDKPRGVGSTDIVAKTRWALRARKAGHAGTLDPMATGVLAVALGEATKTVAVAQEGLKTYRFTVRFGRATDTDDAEGRVIADADARPTDAEIEAALGAYRGEILQVPPQVSAVKVEGARAYDLAREGIAMALEARPLWVETLKLVERPDVDHAVLELQCGKGGYVRAIARDVGRDLGCHAHVTALRRTAAGPFGLEDAIPADALDAIREGLEAPLLPLEAALIDLPEIPVDAAGAARLRHGQPAESPTAGRHPFGAAAWASHDGDAVALVTLQAGALHPTRVFAATPAED